MTSAPPRFAAIDGKLDWKVVGYTGLIVGTIFLLATGGDPWGFSAFVRPMVMGREIVPASTVAGELNFGYLGLHYLLSMLFVLAMAPFLSRLLIGRALCVGLLFGFLFYAGNRFAFTHIEVATRSGEAKVLVTNLCFGLLAAAVYRGLIRGRPRKEFDSQS